MSIKDSFFLERDKAVLVVIDVQEKLCVAMDKDVLKQLVKNVGILLESAAELNIPVLVTEQYVKGLGETLPELKEKATAVPCFEKMAFRWYQYTYLSYPTDSNINTWKGTGTVNSTVTNQWTKNGW